MRSETAQLSVGTPTPGNMGRRQDLDLVVDEFSGRISDLEARTSGGEGFAVGDHVFNSSTSVLEYLVTKKVPNARCLWDLFSWLASMSPKR